LGWNCEGDRAEKERRVTSWKIKVRSRSFPNDARQIGEAMRLRFLDGLRGWGAVVVLLYHVFSQGLPIDTAFGASLQYFVPFNGMLAVFVFFVVSGFSLSVRYLADGNIQSWFRIAAGRYVRLVIPIFVACFIVHLVMASGFLVPPAERLAGFDRFLTFDSTIGHLLKFSFFDVFFNYRFSDTYIGPLWTMSIELSGSFVVLLSVLAVRPLPFRFLFLLGLACLILLLASTPMLALFAIGAALADGFNRGWIDAVPKLAAIVLLSIGCLLPVLLPYSVTAWGVFGASPLTLGCIAIPSIRNWLSGPVSGHFGRISFPLYLVHGPVLSLVGEPLMRNFGEGLILKVIIQLVIVALAFAFAYAFLPINEFAIRLAHRLARSVAGIFFVSSAVTER
jgi:peptidoglycan/LPS O-acetylase OafA/YrhL